MGKILRVLPIVVIGVLGFSLVEALLILPAHLSSKGGRPGKGIRRFTFHRQDQQCDRQRSQKVYKRPFCRFR